MATSISLACRDYFQGFQDLATFKENDSYKNLAGILKIASYFTLVVPLFFGVVYGVSSLIGRITLGDPQSSENQRISSVGQKKLGLTMEEQLAQMFKSPIPSKKLFTIGDTKVGVIFNPNRDSIRIGFISVMDHIALVSNKSIPDEIMERISSQIPAGYTHSTLCLGSYNGGSIFTAVGLE